MNYKLCRIREACDLTGYAPTAFYSRIKSGTLPPPIKITERSSAWPEHELAAVNRARIAGKDDAAVRQLVAELVAARTHGRDMSGRGGTNQPTPDR